ncbi:putative HTH-type transcriptional regulator YybR [Polystyrenella longa]|uniref:Putative HTH-type transcriptional regulator YybR n=1 Tax=Polystyrenella longa TaxID=2528007 RepID=A0A518CLZ7_9PLAN|nr:helix-turn-helix domain-containing protein [Polystyrenella longa]QDU80256.1 putative HTH-type transcriptional regulator YybR [Polystyrenella longa]
MTGNNTKKTLSCPVETTLKIIGGRWKVLIVHFLFKGTQRFGELTRELNGVSAKVLSTQLRELEADGIIHREEFDETPPKVEYSLTPLGRSLEQVLSSMDAWGRTVEGRQPNDNPSSSIAPLPNHNGDLDHLS